jgi:hypothetical protein
MFPGKMPVPPSHPERGKSRAKAINLLLSQIYLKTVLYQTRPAFSGFGKNICLDIQNNPEKPLAPGRVPHYTTSGPQIISLIALTVTLPRHHPYIPFEIRNIFRNLLLL